jgi:hypothetical protein
MTIGIIALLLGLVIATACIGLPYLVRFLSQQPDDDRQAYLEQTGRSLKGIAQEDAALLAREAGHSSKRHGRPPSVEDDGG